MVDFDGQKFYERIAARIREIRVSHGMTHSEMGTAMGISRSAVWNIEGLRQKPTLHGLYLAAQYFHCGVDYFMEEGGDDDSAGTE